MKYSSRQHRIHLDVRGSSGHENDDGCGCEHSAGRQSPVDYDSKLDYDCDGWSGDTRMFDLPSGVSFVDLNAMMKNLQGAPTGQ